MEDESCLKDLVRCRDPRAPQAIAAFEFIRKRQRINDLKHEIDEVQRTLFQQQRPFIPHPLVDVWQKQYSSSTYGVVARYKILALVGGSQQGKTSKGMSIFGFDKTLKVGCQSCPPGVLPSLSTFDRKVHKAILFDECRVDQILQNREFFQASPYLQSMSQSLCNQYLYEIWVYQTALIACSNYLPTSVEEGLSESDADWMSSNVVKVCLAPGQTWYTR